MLIRANNRDRVSPYLVVVPILIIILGFHGRMFSGRRSWARQLVPLPACSGP